MTGGAHADAASVAKHGLLSGMAITWGAGLVVLAIGLALPRLHPVFAATPNDRLLDLFLVSILLMAAHKVESYLTREYLHCPVYQSQGRAFWAGDVRQATFVVFCSLFLVAMLLIYLVLRGAPWPLLLLGVWCAQGLHELHHTGKSLARRRYYSGLATSLAFILFIDVAFLPAYAAHLRGTPTWWPLVYYAVQPPLVLAFYLEERRWQAREAGCPKVSPSCSV